MHVCSTLSNKYNPDTIYLDLAYCSLSRGFFNGKMWTLLQDSNKVRGNSNPSLSSLDTIIAEIHTYIAYYILLCQNVLLCYDIFINRVK